jgi:hypothetical protein
MLTLMGVFAGMVGRMDGLRGEPGAFILIGIAELSSYVWFRKRLPVAIFEAHHGRSVLFVGLLFGAGFLCGTINAFAEGWEWFDLGLIVPITLSVFCFRALFRLASQTSTLPDKLRAKGTSA